MLQRILFNIRNFCDDERGIGVVEVILILLVLVGLVIIFKDQIITLARSIFSSINNQVNTISKGFRPDNELSFPFKKC